MERLRSAGQTVLAVDARSARGYNDSDLVPEGAVRLDPDRAVEQAIQHRLPRDAWLATLCA